MSLADSIVIDRRSEQNGQISGKIEKGFPDWKAEKERWLFVAPHDDDIVLGAGLTFASAIEAGIETWAAVVTTGNAGYCHLDQRETIAATRAKECKESFQLLGLSLEQLIWLRYPDGSLSHHAGFRLATRPADPCVIAGTTGIQSSFTWLLRRVAPTRLFIPSITDLHPDHRCVNDEMIISIFHATGGIWPELGPALPALPALYEYATYSDFRTPPTIRVRAGEELFERKLKGISAYKSQQQIEQVVSVQRQAGAKEFLREVRFDLFRPEECDKLFR